MTFSLFLILASCCCWASDKTVVSYQAIIERSGQSYAADLQLMGDVQSWDFIAEPYKLTIDQKSISLQDKIDKSVQVMAWNNIEQDFDWLILFPCLQKSLQSIEKNAHINQQRFDFEAGSWVIQQNSKDQMLAQWLPHNDSQESLTIILQPSDSAHRD
jgi:hypothetical protein